MSLATDILISHLKGRLFTLTPIKTISSFYYFISKAVVDLKENANISQF